MEKKFQKATLGGGCFWCLEAPFQLIDGITSVTSGYAGGTTANPDYRAVTSGTTGHAEVVQLEFDPFKIDFEGILEIFFTIHDPTQLNRQGADKGTQYRSVILFHDTGQKEIAEKVINRIDSADIFDDPVVTEVIPLETFYPAEAYHQNYYLTNPSQPYCSFVIRPKLEKVRQLFSGSLKH